MLPALLLSVLTAQNLPASPQVESEHEAGDLFGLALATIGDVDGDSVEDVAVACPMFGVYAGRPGCVWIISTRTGRPLLVLEAAGRGDRFGDRLIGPGDLDGDGVPDLVVTCGGSLVETRVLAFSGKTGARIPGPVEQPRDAPLLCAVGDVNRDGRGDYAVAGPNPAPTGSAPDPSRRDRFAIVIVDGATGKTLRRLEPEDGQCWASAMAAVGDLDGDGVQELILAHRQSPRPIEVWSIGSGKLLRTIPSLDTTAVFDVTLAAPGDVDGDGVPDLLVGLVSGVPHRSRVALLDGLSMKELASLQHPKLDVPDGGAGAWSFGEMLLPLPDPRNREGTRLLVGVPQSGSEISRAVVLALPGGALVREHEVSVMFEGMFGVSGCLAGDADGDGVRDYVIGEADLRSGADVDGHAYLYSGKTGRELDRWDRARMNSRRPSADARR